jgi:GMP synthase (glutamine-hydrolysing)
MTLLALQHIACEPPAAFEDELLARSLDLVRVELDEGEALPEWREFEGLIVMGGPMGAYEEDAHPWLVEEKRAIAAAARAGHPVWGVCLGAQLLASALGAAVYPGPAAEVGLLPVDLTPEAADDPVFRHAPASFPTLQWHGDTFDLPEGATLLASSPAFPNQAFRYGRAAYGIQFHMEVLPEMAREWSSVPEYAAYADRVLGEGGMERLMSEFDDAEAGMRATGRAMFERWAELAVPVAG